MALKRFVDRLIRLSMVVMILGAAALLGVLRWLLISPQTLLRTVYVLVIVLAGLGALALPVALGYGIYGCIRSKKAKKVLEK